MAAPLRVPQQKIFRIRREYNGWVADETMEDYALRYTPRSFRKWSEFRVANTAFGATSFLALEAIGATIALSYGFTNALAAILVVGLIVFLTGLPISYYAARDGLDMDLLTRGAGFGYLGSTLTSLIYAGFTFIFFALEAAILAQALQLVVPWPLPVCYVVSSLAIVPLVMHGITLISRLQAWTQPVWIILCLLPFIVVAAAEPGRYAEFTTLAGRISGHADFELAMFGAASTVAFSLVVQIGEQVDYLRFLPQKTAANRCRWWAAVIIAGPGWIVPGMLKMLGGAFLAFLVLQQQSPLEQALQPTQMYLTGFGHVFASPTLVLAATVILVLVSQVKINVTNAYAGSLAWSNFFARLTHSHPGRVVWLVFNVMIAVLLMTLGVFGALERVLSLYSNVAIAWVGALVADLVINKPAGWSPRQIEFRRAYLPDINPVGLGATVTAALLAIACYAGLFGTAMTPFAPFVALVTAVVVSPLLAWRTRGRHYLARRDPKLWAPGRSVTCSVCENTFESEDMAWCPAYGAPICSLCCTLESRCHERCKPAVDLIRPLRPVLARLPRLRLRAADRTGFRLADYFLVTLGLVSVIGVVLGVVYLQAAAGDSHAGGLLAGTSGQGRLGGDDGPAPGLALAFLQAFALMSLVAAVGAWWTVLSSASRRMAEEESERQYGLLAAEIEAHQRTDAALQAAKDLAESANQAKTRYVAGMTHELRTPLNGILGYAQILQRDAALRGEQRVAIDTIRHSGEHLNRLVDGLLDLARIEAGRLRLDPAPLPMQEFLDDLVRMVAPEVEARGLAFHLVIDGPMPEYTRADAHRLRQILLNLLGNAIRFTDQGSVTLRIIHQYDVARFEVIDTGIGIAAQDMERIFLPFERGSAGRRSGEPGTGLGLTITHLLTQLMGGELTVRSAPGQGSTFLARLYLPAVAAPPMREPVRRHRPVVGYLGPRRRLLIVDDHPIQRQLLAGLLLPLGFEIREAASGIECLELVADERPDAVLLDLSLDGIDGWTTARRIRATGLIRPPIIIVSANAFENTPDKLAAAGAQAFVDKPVIESALMDALGRTLELEWIDQAPQEHWHAGVAPPLVLPDDSRSVLIRLCRLGHGRGLLTAIDRTLAAHPDQAEALTSLRRHAERFAFEAALALLIHEEADGGDETPPGPDLTGAAR